ncbi:MAG: hypothetical protein KGH72_02925 [Candidatus Micrarchaeota archaeon]|nr:hypothetical protein [Candidatus Micrarchaeota archaeon]
MEGRTVRGSRTHVIVPTKFELDYLAARAAVRDSGGLPPHALHDDTLVFSERWRELGNLYHFLAWSREILVYPEISGVFRKGVDVVDSEPDYKGRRWVFPASFVPEEALGRRGVALFVDPAIIRRGGRGGTNVVIQADPASVVILERFLQGNHQKGRIDPATRVPQGPTIAEIPYEQARWIWRINGIGVRPLARGGIEESQDPEGSRRDVFALLRDNVRLGVSFVSTI